MMVNAGVKPEEGALALAAVPANPENAEECAMHLPVFPTQYPWANDGFGCSCISHILHK